MRRKPVSLVYVACQASENRPLTLDTYAFARKHQESGFTTQQVEALLEIFRLISSENLATGQDIEQLRLEITQVRSEVTHLRAELEHKIELARRDIIIRLGGLIIAALTAQSILIKLL
jgi:hypothetical protein